MHNTEGIVHGQDRTGIVDGMVDGLALGMGSLDHLGHTDDLSLIRGIGGAQKLGLAGIVHAVDFVDEVISLCADAVNGVVQNLMSRGLGLVIR